MSDRDGPKPLKKGFPETGDQGSESPARDTPAFGAPGNHSVRVAVELRDRQGLIYSVESKAVVIRVESQPREAQAASDAIRPMLYLVLPHASLKPGHAEKLRAALPALGESGAASAARRLLAIDALRASKPGDERRAAVAECDRLRATIPGAVRGEFDILAAGVAFGLGEYGPAVGWYNDIPSGPRRIDLGVRYYFRVPEPLRGTMR